MGQRSRVTWEGPFVRLDVVERCAAAVARVKFLVSFWCVGRQVVVLLETLLAKAHVG